jgi:hypothetical protein
LIGRGAVREQDSDEEKELEVFCDDPDCTKRYAHEHVNKSVSFLQSHSKGTEALAHNALLRL